MRRRPPRSTRTAPPFPYSTRFRSLLGGDVEVALSQREASGEEKAAFRRFGQLSETIRLRAMAQRPGSGDGPSAVLTELKGVDAAYPLYGTLMLKSGPAGTLAADEVVIGQGLAARLALQPGQHPRYGTEIGRASCRESVGRYV